MPYTKKHTFSVNEETYSKEYCEHMIKSYVKENIKHYYNDIEVSLVIEDGEIVCKVYSKE